MFVEPGLNAGIVILLAVAIAEYIKWRVKSKGFNWLAAAGILLIFSGTFGTAAVLEPYLTTPVWVGLKDLFAVIGWLFALVGTVFIAYETLITR